MNAKYKLNALAVLALSMAFYFFFMFTKHDPAVAAIMPFGDDPYDAIGSFCLILSLVLSVFSLVRAFRPYRPGPPPAPSRAFLARTQIAVPLGVLVTLSADGIAMARHISQWAGKPSTRELAALMLGMAAISLVVLFVVRQSARAIELPAFEHGSRRALIVVLVCAAVLTVFPEEIIHSVFLHFLAIVLGDILIAAPQAALAVALLPFDTAAIRAASAAAQSRSRLWIQWGAVMLLGIAIGASILGMEIFGEGAGEASLIQMLLVSSVFVGAGTSALLIAFAFFKKPLGLFLRVPQP
jgi:hypothetical protein